MSPALATLLALCLSLLQGEGGQGKAQGAAGKASPVLWEEGLGLEGVTRAERKLVAGLDRAWSTGRPAEVLARFRFLHPQAETELASRVLSTTGGRPCLRSSRIRARTCRDGFACLFLSAELRLPGRLLAEEGLPRVADRASTFELLILKDAGAKPEALLLLETTEFWQGRVRGRAKAGGPTLQGCALGRASFSCPVCNYQFGTPDTGNWVLAVRPRYLSGHLEALSLFDLDRDLMAEITILPVQKTGGNGAERLRDLGDLMKASLSMFCKVHDMELREPSIEEAFLTGKPALSSIMDFQDLGGAHRFCRIFALRQGALDYLISVQGSRVAVLEEKETVSRILGGFRLLDPDRTEEEGCRALERLHGGRGRFRGRTFVLESLGLELEGPEGWKPWIQISMAEFRVGWHCPDTDSTLSLTGVARPRAPWSRNAAVLWLDRWFRENRSTLEDLRADSRLLRGKRGGIPSLEIRYSFVPSPAQGRALGLMVLLPRGRTLLAVDSLARPCSGQKKIRADLDRLVSSLRLGR